MSLFNLSLALNGLATDSVAVRRPIAGTFDDNGMAVPPTFTTFSSIRVSWQNLRGDELKHVPEGDRVTAWQKVWPQMLLETGDRIDSSKGTYIVQELEDNMNEGGFSAAFARRVGDGEA